MSGIDSNWKKVEKKLSGMEKLVMASLHDSMEEVVEDCKDRANQKYPFRGEPVSNGVRVSKDKVTGYVGASLERVSGGRSKQHNRWERSDAGRPIGLFWELGFRLVFYGRPTGKFLGPKPFLRPAFDATVPEAKEKLGEAFIEGILQNFATIHFNKVLT